MSLVWLDSSGGVTEVLISCSVNLLSPPVPPRWSSALHGRFSSPMNIIKAHLLPQKKIKIIQHQYASCIIMYHHVWHTSWLLMALKAVYFDQMMRFRLVPHDRLLQFWASQAIWLMMSWVHWMLQILARPCQSLVPAEAFWIPSVPSGSSCWNWK